MKQLVIALSGKKQSGKSSTCNYIASKYFNLIHPDLYDFGVNSLGELTFDKNVITIAKAFEIMRRKPDVKLYSFADPLKDFCINVLGATWESCYGTDAQKDAPIAHLLWENTPIDTRPVSKKYHEPVYNEYAGCLKEGWSEDVHKSGPMSGRELMQWLGTDIMRRLYHDVWAKGTYRKIANEGFRIALIADGRFPNEIDSGVEVQAKSLRLLRAVKDDGHASETALDNYPLHKYSAVLDNRQMTLQEQLETLDPIVNKWFKEAGIQNERSISQPLSSKEVV